MHVHDERVIGGTAFDRIETRQRFGVGRIGGETVDGLGRNRDDAAAPQDRDRARDDVIGIHYVTEPSGSIAANPQNPRRAAGISTPPSARW